MGYDKSDYWHIMGTSKLPKGEPSKERFRGRLPREVYENYLMVKAKAKKIHNLVAKGYFKNDRLFDDDYNKHNDRFFELE